MPTNEGPENTTLSITFSSRVAMSQLKRATSDEKVIRGAVFFGPEVMSACHITILTYYNNVDISVVQEYQFGQNFVFHFFPAKGIFAQKILFQPREFFLANWIMRRRALQSTLAQAGHQAGSTRDFVWYSLHFYRPRRVEFESAGWLYKIKPEESS